MSRPLGVGLALLLGLGLGQPAKAGMDRLSLTPSQASVLVTGVSAVMVVSGPFYAAHVGARGFDRGKRIEGAQVADHG